MRREGLEIQKKWAAFQTASRFRSRLSQGVNSHYCIYAGLEIFIEFIPFSGNHFDTIQMIIEK